MTAPLPRRRPVPPRRVERMQPRPQPESSAAESESGADQAEASATERTAPWLLPFRWPTRETFWHDLTANVVAAGVTGAFVWAFGVASSWASSSSGWQTIKTVSTYTLFAVVLVLVFWATFLYSPERHRHRPVWLQRTIWVSAFWLALWGAVAQFHSFTGALNDSWVWPFNTPGWHVQMSDEAT